MAEGVEEPVIRTNGAPFRRCGAEVSPRRGLPPGSEGRPGQALSWARSIGFDAPGRVQCDTTLLASTLHFRMDIWREDN